MTTFNIPEIQSALRKEYQKLLSEDDEDAKLLKAKNSFVRCGAETRCSRRHVIIHQMMELADNKPRSDEVENILSHHLRLALKYFRGSKRRRVYRISLGFHHSVGFFARFVNLALFKTGKFEINYSGGRSHDSYLD